MTVLITRAKCKTVRNMELARAGIAVNRCDYVGFAFSRGTPGGPSVKQQQPVGIGKMDVSLNAASCGQHVPCSACHLPGTPCAMLLCDSRGGGLAITHGWLHVPHTASRRNSEMTDLPGCDHPSALLSYSLALCQAVPARGDRKTSLGGGTLVPVSVDTSPLVPLGFRSSHRSPSVRTGMAHAEVMPLQHAQSFQSAHGLGSVCVKLANPEMLSHCYVITPVLLFTFHWESCKADLGYSSF